MEYSFNKTQRASVFYSQGERLWHILSNIIEYMIIEPFKTKWRFQYHILSAIYNIFSTEPAYKEIKASIFIFTCFLAWKINHLGDT